MPLHCELEIDYGAFAAAEREIATGVRRGGQLGVTEAVTHARQNHPWKNRTGETEAGIRGSYVSTDRGIEGVIESLAETSSWLEEGTKPHTIVPVNAKALRWEDGDGVHFARKVRHPGGKSFPFIGPAVQKFERVVEREVDIAAAKADSILNR